MKIAVRRRLKVLDKEQIYAIHLATLEVLERVGVNVKSEKALKMLDKIGVDVDYKKQLARMPSYLVEEAIRKTPKRFILFARKPEYHVRMEDGRVYFSLGGLPTNIIDLEGKRRQALMRDTEDVVRLMDGLQNISIVDGGVYPTDIPEPVNHAYQFLAKVENTEKTGHSCLLQGVKVAKDFIQLASTVQGGFKDLKRRPFIYGHVNPVSPLTHDKLQTEGFLEFAKHGLPLAFSPEIQGGATGPATLAGILVQQNAEILSGIVIAQFAADSKRRSPVIYGTVSSIFDMRTGVFVLGTAECGLINVASAQLGHYYGLPVRGTAGVTDSKTLDAQMYEAGVTLLMAALGGVNFVLDAAGAIEPGVMALSYAKMVVDNDLIGMVMRILEGIEVRDETLAVDVIGRVGPGGHFLTQKHTREFFKREFYFPALSDRVAYESWMKRGAKKLGDVALEKARQILRDHHPQPLEKELKKELREMVKRIERRELKGREQV